MRSLANFFEVWWVIAAQGHKLWFPEGQKSESAITTSLWRILIGLRDRILGLYPNIQPSLANGGYCI